jgi:hypothetical protein
MMHSIHSIDLQQGRGIYTKFQKNLSKICEQLLYISIQQSKHKKLTSTREEM